MPRHEFEKGHPKWGGKKKGVPPKNSIWAIDSLKARGVDYEAMLAKALKDSVSPDIETREHALELLDRLIKLAQYIANRPKETVGLEGIEELVINRYKPEEKPKA